MWVSFFWIIFYANCAANRFLGEATLLSFMLAKLNAQTGWLDPRDFIECHMFIKGFAIVSLVFLSKFHQVWNSVSVTPSKAIKGTLANVTGTFHNFLYRFHCVQALCIASHILLAVFHTHSNGLTRAQYSAVCTVSVNVCHHVHSVERIGASAVLPNLLPVFFRNHMIFVVRYKYFQYYYIYFSINVKYFLTFLLKLKKNWLTYHDESAFFIVYELFFSIDCSLCSS